MVPHDDSEPSQRGFCGRIRTYGRRRLIRSWDFRVAALAAVGFAGLAQWSGRLGFLSRNICPELAAIAGGFVGIVLAAVAIMALSEARFVVILRRLRVLGNILTAYEVALMASVAAILVNLITWGASPGEGVGYLPVPGWASQMGLIILCLGSLFSFLYAALAIAALIPRTLDLAQQWAAITDEEDQDSQTEQ